MIVFITIAAFLSTLIGGLLAIRLRDKLHLVLGFSAGAIVGVAFFDLLPESLELAGDLYSPQFILSLTAIGFIGYLIIDRFFIGHHHNKIERSTFGASSLSIHSFLDGIGIGLAFQVSPTIGAIVAAAVLTHDFSDGINTVSLVLKNGGSHKLAYRWLLIDAIAPVLGVLVTLFFSVPGAILGLLLALFSGFFLYIGASDLIPESYHTHPVHWTTFMTVLGMGTLYLVIQFAGI